MSSWPFERINATYKAISLLVNGLNAQKQERATCGNNLKRLTEKFSANNNTITACSQNTTYKCYSQLKEYAECVDAGKVC